MLSSVFLCENYKKRKVSEQKHFLDKNEKKNKDCFANKLENEKV